jgi:hypothetical protein
MIKKLIVPGIVLGLFVVVWTYVMGFTGWYKDPAMMAAFWLVILAQIGVLVWALRKTAQEGWRYWKQVGAGTLISVIAGLIIIPGSLLFTTVVFPHYFDELRAVYEQQLQLAGKSPQEIASMMDAYSVSQTPSVQAVMGFLGTVVTGLFISLVTAIFLRSKS